MKNQTFNDHLTQAIAALAKGAKFLPVIEPRQVRRKTGRDLLKAARAVQKLMAAHRAKLARRAKGFENRLQKVIAAIERAK